MLRACLTAAFLFAANAVRDAVRDPVDERVASLIAQMTTSEKVAQLFYGRSPTMNAAELIKLAPLGFGGIYVDDFNLSARNEIQTAYRASTRMGIPVSFFAETLRSAGVKNSTVFAVPALLGCSWNTSLVEAIGGVIAREMWALGGDRSLSPVLQVLSDARWGRVSENFGESDVHVALFGGAMTRGLLAGGGGNASTYLPANFSLTPFAKHAVAYGMSNADGFSVSISPRELNEVYMRPWREFASAGGRGLMLSHPVVNGVPMHAHAALQAALRALPGLEGALFGSDNENVRWLSDAFSYASNRSDATRLALLAGCDQEMDNFNTSLYLAYLCDLAADDAAVAAAIDRAAGNVLRAKFAANLFDQPAERDPAVAAEVVRTPAALALAADAVRQSATLLVNGGDVLPLTSLRVARRIAILGPNGGGCSADTTQGCFARANMVGLYSPYSATGSNGAISVPTLEDALRARVSGADVIFAAGATIGSSRPNATLLAEALSALEGADVVVLALGDSACVDTGFGHCSCGEGADRVSLDLPGTQSALLLAALNATGNLAGAIPPDGGFTPYSRPGGPVPLVAVLIHGRPVTFGPENWLTPGASPGSRAALVSAWLPAEAGADALLDLIEGLGNFGGRTSVAWPRSVGHVRSPGAPWLQWPDSQGTGNWLPPREGVTGVGSWAPLFPLGFGLSYTTFALSNLSLPEAAVSRASDAFPVSVTLTNTGTINGDAVVFVAYSVRVPGVLRAARRLAAFARASVLSGASVDVTLSVRLRDLDRWDDVALANVIDTGVYTLEVGTCLTSAGVIDDAFPCSPLIGSVSVAI